MVVNKGGRRYFTLGLFYFLRERFIAPITYSFPEKSQVQGNYRLIVRHRKHCLRFCDVSLVYNMRPSIYTNA
jgi:hypothetical protein